MGSDGLVHFRLRGISAKFSGAGREPSGGLASYDLGRGGLRAGAGADGPGVRGAAGTVRTRAPLERWF
jgi:hypothetical protein